MPQVFLSHSSKDKRLILKVNEYMQRSLIETWLDVSNIRPGTNIWENINSGIRQNRYFMPFLSTNYCESLPCMDELSKAYGRHVKGEVKLIPILLCDDKESELYSFSSEKTEMIKDIIENIKYVEFDSNNKEQSLKDVIDAIWLHELVRFNPIENIEINGQKLQLLQLQLATKELPSTFLETWGFRIDEFFSDNDKDDKPIKTNIPVAFNGSGPNWLITYLTIPFKNQRTVFVYNNPSKAYFCSYSEDKSMIGKVLPVANERT